MRRHPVTLLKYLIVGFVCVVFGPFALRLLFGSVEQTTRNEIFPVERAVIPNKVIREDVNKGNLIAVQVDKDGKYDWHNYKLIEEDLGRKGPGEQGAAVILTPSEEKQKDTLYKTNGFNAFVSDKISLQRSLKDIRHADCVHKKYLYILPNASVVIPFHNEHWSTLLRTVYSVLNRSPKHLIHEVILVDDFSNKEHCKEPLDKYVKEKFTNVKVIHAKQREGLIRTRLLGAKAATGQVLIFLDSHVEANVNWLAPLLEPIAQNRKTVVCPFIDVIDYETFSYRAQDEGARGAFDWELFYKRLPLLPNDLLHPAEPFKSPVMAGGLFAIDREWFWDLGGYDPGLDIWGGEQYELSFKIWQCGGEMVDAPCSRVGHVYRKFAPFPNPGVGDFVGRNYRRVAEVWMDEYKEYIYLRRPHYRDINPGDISAQLDIRKRLNCKPFSWFMKEVAYDIPKFYPPVEPPNVADGEIRSKASNLCLDTRFRGPNERFQLESCIKDGQGQGEQKFEMTWHKDIRPWKRSVCFDVSQTIMKAPVILYTCHGMQGNQRWKYNIETRQLYHPISQQCLDCDTGSREVFMNPCNKNLKTQQWHFEHTNATALQIEWKAA
ncbi:polypeptide N-acetylgalactosaminyltransferase 10 [Octopus bimaculoides]|nr:polypeptide N-acetylgalactosaminyltransferase 10 [Octopus bimaculoides]